MDGQLVLTDGQAVEQITSSGGDEIMSTDVILPLPTAWKTIPETAIVIAEKWREVAHVVALDAR